MKVLILGNKLFSTDMQWGFTQAGHTASIISANNAVQMQSILAHTDADILITLGAPLELRLDAMVALAMHRPAKLFCVHWDTDGISSTYYPSHSGEGIEMDVLYASRPHLTLTVCPEMLDFLHKRSFAARMMHYAYSPVAHHPLEKIGQQPTRINLIGSSYSTVVFKRDPQHLRYTSLKVLLAPLLENGYDVHLYGDNGFVPLIRNLLGIHFPGENFHGYLPYERTCAAYQDAFMNIALQNHEQTITKRTFEILGSGGFALAPDTEEIRKTFVPGRDLITTSSPEQTLELVHHYQSHPDQWKQIRQNAVVSVAKHTYRERAELIVEAYHEMHAKP